MSILPVAELTGHTDRAWSTAWNPTRPIIATCSGDRSIRIYSYRTVHNLPSSPDGKGKRVMFDHQHTIPTAHTRTIRNLAWSPDGKLLATASFDSTVGIWRYNARRSVSALGEGIGGEWNGDEEEEGGEWECVTTLEGHESECKSVDWSNDGRLIASCSRDKSVWVWEMISDDEDVADTDGEGGGGVDFECLAVLMEHEQDVKNVSFSPVEELLASTSYDDTIRLYRDDPSLDEWTTTHILPPKPPNPENVNGHKGTVWSAAWHPGGDYLASVSDDFTVKIWSRARVAPAPLSTTKDTEAGSGSGGRMGRNVPNVWRVGAAEKEKWTCVASLQGYHDRTIYGVDWTSVGGRRGGEVGMTRAEERGEESLGRLVTCGADGKICVFEISKSTDPTSTTTVTVNHELIASIEDAHGVADVNSVKWCKISQSSSSASSKAPPVGGRITELGEDDDQDEDEEDYTGGEGGEGKWGETVDLIASAGDDGVVRIWKVVD